VTASIDVGAAAPRCRPESFPRGLRELGGAYVVSSYIARATPESALTDRISHTGSVLFIEPQPNLGDHRGCSGWPPKLQGSPHGNYRNYGIRLGDRRGDPRPVGRGGASDHRQRRQSGIGRERDSLERSGAGRDDDAAGS